MIETIYCKAPSIAVTVCFAFSATVSGGNLQFTEVTQSAGITHSHSYPAGVPSSDFDREYRMMTGGAVAEDFDGDGFVDLYVLQGGASANCLYMNQGDGTFMEDAAARGADQTGFHMGVTAADYDSDGDVDIFISCRESPHLLLTNDGSGFFTANTIWFSEPSGWATSPSWGDIDNDGLLDLALGAWGPDDQEVYIFKNQGSGFTRFQFLIVPGTFIPIFADLNEDRFQDLIAIADFGETSWYFNNQSGIFLPAGSSDVENGMGSAVGDIDNDGDLDLFITSIRDLDGAQSNWGTTGNRLLLNDGNGNFSDITDAAGVRDGFWGWGAVFGDLDNDGDLDLFLVNGWSETELGAPAEFNNTPARLFENLGNNVFAEVAEASGAADRGQGRCTVLFDYDNDGDLDIFIANHQELVDLGDDTYELRPGDPVLLRNDTVGSGHWLKVNLSGIGTPHHSHGIGSRVHVEAGSVSQMRELNASSGFNGHGPNRIAHFGLADQATVDRVRAVWTNGDQSWVETIAADQTITLTSPAATVSSREIVPGESVVAYYPSSVMPGVEVIWTAGTDTFSNPATMTLNTPGIHILRADVFEDSSRAVLLRTELLEVTVLGVLEEDRSIARIWNEETLDAIRIDFPNPAVHARNLFHLSIAMWDAWAAYSATAVGYVYHGKVFATDLAQARHEAISYAAYRVLSARYASSVSASTTQALLDLRMEELGYDRGNTSTLGTDPASLGNRIANAILTWADNDGSREAQGYDDPGYSPVNAPLDLRDHGTILVDFNRWQPLKFEVAMTQNGQVASEVQVFVGSHWGEVRPFAMRAKEGDLYFDPGLPPLFGTVREADYINGNVKVIQHSSWLDPDDGIMMDASPVARGLNTLGENDGQGHGTIPNPATREPYQSNWIKRGDYGRALAEFWADGPNSETPPGHWNTLANQATDHPAQLRKFRGVGPELDALEWDVKMYFALNAALHDAAIAAWGCKRAYDYIRPISSIRFLGQTGQLPEIPGLIEKITTASSSPGERHHDLVTAGASVGQTVIHAWGGEPLNPDTEYTGRDWILAEDWMPYQKDTFVTPAFAGYVSGHSVFSRAAAEVLTYITGDEYFPGGMASHTFPAGSLEFELGPTEAITLQWARYFDASDEAGLSRLFGGIHVPADDGPGRIMGSKVGLNTMAVAEKYFDGSILANLEGLSIALRNDGYELSWKGIPGMFFQVQKSPDLAAWTDVGKRELIVEEGLSATVSSGNEPLFFRIMYFDSPSPD